MVKRAGVIAIVPASGGSKSIPRKNVKLLGGVPLLAYSIEAGLTARFVDRVIVTTDDEEIAASRGRFGADVPFMRPAALAEDTTPDLPAFQHALELAGSGTAPGSPSSSSISVRHRRCGPRTASTPQSICCERTRPPIPCGRSSRHHRIR